MKVCQVLYSGLGGHGSVALSLATSDVQKKCSYSFLFYGVEPVFKDYKRVCKNNQFDYSYIKKRHKLGFNYWTLIRLLRQEKPDVILLHSVQLILPAFFFKLVYGAKIVTVEHQPINLRRVQENVMTFFSCVLANHVVFLTKEFKNQLLGNLVYRSICRRCSIISNGVDSNLFNYNFTTANKKGIQLLMLSRLSSQKDHITLLNAMKILAKENNTNFKLTIAGDGNTMDSLVSYVNKNQLNDFVKFEGAVGENTIVRLLHNTDIYIHSTFGETLSMSILQVMSSGTPVIASNVAGINTVFSEKEVCFFPLQNATILAEKINDLAKNSKKRKEYSENGRKIIDEKFSSKIMSNSYLKLFKTLVKHRI